MKLRAVKGATMQRSFHLVICNQHKCKTLYPHTDPKHVGPCIFCWRKLRRKALKRKGNVLYIGGENV